MYRDDLEAAQASIRTLEATLAAERQQRLAAEAATRAANALRDEAILSAKRHGSAVGGNQRRWVSLAALTVGTLMLGYLWIGSRADRRRSGAEARRLSYEVQRARIVNLEARKRIELLERNLRAARIARPAAATLDVETDSARPLTRTQIQAAMRAITSDVQACYDRYGVPGLLMAQIKIDAEGDVVSARIRGIFSGTPSGACAKKVIVGAKFPKNKGPGTTISYPFILR